MKRTIFTLLLSLFAAMLFAQTNTPPTGFNYQALVYKEGKPLQQQKLTLQVSLQNQGGTVFYTESHEQVTTSKQGVVNLQIGEGKPVSGTMADVDWAQGIFVAVKVDVGNGLVSLGAPVKLQAVPYALYAMATPMVKATKESKEKDSPVFQVVNSEGVAVFSVYENAVRFSVLDESADEAGISGTEHGQKRGVRGGFAVATRGGGRGAGDLQTMNRFSIGNGSIRMLVDEANEDMRGVRGGFAVATSGIRRGAYAEPVTRFALSGPRVDFITDPSVRGVRGGFAVAIRRPGRGEDAYNPLLNVDDNASYFTLRKAGSPQQGTFSLRDRQNPSSVLVNFTTEGQIQSDKTTIVNQPNDISKLEVSWILPVVRPAGAIAGELTFANGGRWAIPEVMYDGNMAGYTVVFDESSDPELAKLIEVKELYRYNHQTQGIQLKPDVLVDAEKEQNTTALKVCLIDNPSLCKEVARITIMPSKISAIKMASPEYFQRVPAGEAHKGHFPVRAEIQDLGDETIFENLTITDVTSDQGDKITDMKLEGGFFWFTVPDPAQFSEGKSVNFTLKSPYLEGGEFTFELYVRLTTV